MTPDTPVWREIRAEAEAGRASMEALFDPEALREYLPIFPETIPPERKNFGGQWGIRLAMGCMLWLDSNP